MLMSFYVSRPNDLFPVIRWIAPEFTLWIRLNSTDQSKAVKTMQEGTGVETLDMFKVVYGKMFTCSVVSVPFMSSLS